MKTLILHAVTGFLLHNIIIATGGEPAICEVATCVCTNDTSRDPDHQDVYSVTCHMNSVGLSNQKGEFFSPHITSLKLICIDRHEDSHINPHSFSQLNGLLELTLENCNFATVSKDAFVSMPYLQSLEFNHCLFAEMPNNVFDNSAGLSRLTITHCGLQTLPWLCSLRNLQLLNVSGQGVMSLDHCLIGCGADVSFNNLTVLDVSNNSLTELPSSLMTRMPNLRELYIQHNAMEDISLTVHTRLEVLDALGQNLKEAVFSTDTLPPDLQVFKLEGSRSLLFPLKCFGRLSNLTVLHAQYFSLNDSFWNVLPSLKRLRQLALPQNHLTSIDLTGSVPLTHLNLSRNSISGISESTFATQKELVEIDLSWNNITKLVTDIFVNMTSLKTLRLEHNQIAMVLQSTFNNVPSLEQLVLANNNLRSLPIFLFRGLSSLKVFIVDHNQIYGLPYLTNVPQLVILSASYNKIEMLLPRRFSGLPNLEYLFLRGNRIRTVESSMFQHAPVLALLDLKENRISEVKSFGSHPMLRWIMLEQNQIQEASGVFRHLPQLTALFLDHNYLTRLTSHMLPSSLRLLSLSWNYLTYIEPLVFTPLPNLIAVNLAANFYLRTLQLSMIEVSPDLSPKPRFTVGPNVFDCNCQMADLKAWTQTGTTSEAGTLSSSSKATLPELHGIDSVNCTTHFTGAEEIPFQDVPLQDFVCPYKDTLCEDSCTCCSAQQSHISSLHSKCTCLLGCPSHCSCFHGGPKYAMPFTRVFCDERNLTHIPESIPLRATHIRMDGNSLTSLVNGTLNQLTQVMYLNLNNNAIVSVEPGCFMGMNSLEVLDLSHNNIEQINETTFGEMTVLKELDLQYNFIQYVHYASFYKLKVLKRLNLSHNWLKNVDTFAYFPPITAIHLAYNPWSCDCKFSIMFLRFLISHREKVRDYHHLRCIRYQEQQRAELKAVWTSSQDLREGVTWHRDNRSDLFLMSAPAVLMSTFRYEDYCSNSSQRQGDVISHHASSRVLTPVIISIVVLAAISVIVGVLCARYRPEIQALLFVKLGVRLWDHATHLDRQDFVRGQEDDPAVQNEEVAAARIKRPRVYDAFVSYSHHDEEFVVRHLVPRLEQQGPRAYTLCVHYRDFPVGASIADTIVESVEKSQRTLLLLSNNFVDSEWCRFEFQAAHQHMLQEGHRLIIVLLEDVAEDHLDPDLKMALKTHTYLSVGDPWFWEKLYFAMPHLHCQHIDTIHNN